MSEHPARPTLQLRVILRFMSTRTSGWRDEWPRPANRRMNSTLCCHPKTGPKHSVIEFNCGTVASSTRTRRELQRKREKRGGGNPVLGRRSSDSSCDCNPALQVTAAMALQGEGRVGPASR